MFLQSHLDNRPVKTLARLRGDALLAEYLKEWTMYDLGAFIINSLCHYLNKEHIAKNAGTCVEVRTMALQLWREKVLSGMKDHIVQAVFQSIEADRNGTPPNPAIKGVLASMVAVGLDNKRPTCYYQMWFEAPFLVATEQYYNREGERKLQAFGGMPSDGQCAVAGFMFHVESRMSEEQRRITLYLDKSSEKVVIRCLVRVLVESKVEVLLSRFQEWLDKGKYDDLRRLFRLLRMSETGLDPLRKLFEDRIDSDGREEMQNVDPKEPSTFVVSYVEVIAKVHARFDSMVQSVFEKHLAFQQALEKGCKRFINANIHTAKVGSVKSAELIAKYMHHIMKASTNTAENFTDKEVESRLNAGIRIFSFLEDKDVFLSNYSNLLSRRLIFRMSCSNEAEETAISKLKEICGHERTYRLQRMFTDCSVSKDMNEKFRAWIRKEKGPEPMELPLDVFQVEVLTSGSWPPVGACSVNNLPKEISTGHALFEAYYNSERTGRKLTWASLYSNGVLKTNYPLPRGKSYDLHVLTSHMAVLYLGFQNAGWEGDAMPWVRVPHLQSKCSMDDKELNYALAVLVKVKILVQGDGANAQAYALNPGFQYKDKKVLVHQLVGTKADTDASPDEAHQGMRMVEEDRKYAIQAAVVRVLKNRKLIGHQALVAEVIDQLKGSFHPTVQDIKRNIDTLIEKEYMERRTEDGGYYEYIA
jgi:cullin 1